MEVVDYFEKCPSSVSLKIVILVLNLSINQGWATRKVDLSIYLLGCLSRGCLPFPPILFDTDEYRAKMVTQLNKSFHGQVQSPLYWYNYLKGSFEVINFKPRPLDPCVFHVRGMISLIY